MSERIDEENFNQHLAAFADGELDAAQMAPVVDYLAAHPEALHELRAHQRFRTSAASILRTMTPGASASLRARIEQIAADERPAGETPRSTRIGAPIAPWLWAAAAAILIVGFTAGRWLSTPAGPQVAITEPAPVVPVGIISHAQAIHADCSRLAIGLHSADYPADVGRLADAVRRDLAGGKPYPDFTSIGFSYRGAGPCGSPLANTIHLLFKDKDPKSNHAISLFVQVNSGQFSLDAGKLYSLSGPRSPFPMFAWRTERVVYFLIADDAPTAEKARALIAPAAGLSGVVQ